MVRIASLLTALLLPALLLPAGCDTPHAAAPPADTTTAHAALPQGDKTMEKATFAAGCFWGVEATFRQVKGVIDTRAGYTGGRIKNPTYRQVCSHATGHAEAVEVTFDPNVVKYETLLDVFFNGHDPTTLNRQGPDVGDQYRSAIFYHTPAQREAAVRFKGKLEAGKVFKRPIVTQITPAVTFWPAEDYHQRYLEKRGMAACHF